MLKDFFLNSHTQKKVVNQGQKYKMYLYFENIIYYTEGE